MIDQRRVETKNKSKNEKSNDKHNDANNDNDNVQEDDVTTTPIKQRRRVSEAEPRRQVEVDVSGDVVAIDDVDDVSPIFVGSALRSWQLEELDACAQVTVVIINFVFNSISSCDVSNCCFFVFVVPVAWRSSAERIVSSRDARCDGWLERCRGR